MKKAEYLNPVEESLIKLAVSQKEEAIKRIEESFAKVVQPILVAHRATGDVTFLPDEGGITIVWESEEEITPLMEVVRA